MKKVEIVGKNYFGKWDKVREACRGIILEDGKILMSYETVTDQWMIPGGGKEASESDIECCMREIAEETGFLVEVSDCRLELVEYYENVKLPSRYFFCKIVGTTERKLTKGEKQCGMEPRWIAVDEIKEILSKHEDYAATDEMRRGLYQREFTALTMLL